MATLQPGGPPPGCFLPPRCLNSFVKLRHRGTSGCLRDVSGVLHAHQVILSNFDIKRSLIWRSTFRRCSPGLLRRRSQCGCWLGRRLRPLPASPWCGRSALAAICGQLRSQLRNLCLVIPTRLLIRPNGSGRRFGGDRPAVCRPLVAAALMTLAASAIVAYLPAPRARAGATVPIFRRSGLPSRAFRAAPPVHLRTPLAHCWLRRLASCCLLTARPATASSGRRGGFWAPLRGPKGTRRPLTRRKRACKGPSSPTAATRSCDQAPTNSPLLPPVRATASHADGGPQRTTAAICPSLSTQAWVGGWPFGQPGSPLPPLEKDEGHSSPALVARVGSGEAGGPYGHPPHVASQVPPREPGKRRRKRKESSSKKATEGVPISPSTPTNPGWDKPAHLSQNAYGL